MPILSPQTPTTSEEKIITNFERGYLGAGSSCGQPGVLGMGRGGRCSPDRSFSVNPKGGKTVVDD